MIASKVIRYLRLINYLPPEDDESAETLTPFDEAFTDSEQLTVAAFASNAMKIAFGENAGKVSGASVKRLGFLVSMF